MNLPRTEDRVREKRAQDKAHKTNKQANENKNKKKEQPREVGKKPGALGRGCVKKEGVINSFKYCRDISKVSSMRTENCPLSFATMEVIDY